MGEIQEIDQGGDIGNIRLNPPAAVSVSLVGTTQGVMADIEIINQPGNIGNIREFVPGAVDVSPYPDTTAGIADIVAVGVLLQGIVVLGTIVTAVGQAVAVRMLTVVKSRTDIAAVTVPVQVVVFLVRIDRLRAVVADVADTVAVEIGFLKFAI